jgi:hypothetical protein
MMPAAMTAATASPALRMSSKLAMMQRASLRLGHQLDGHLGRDRQHALAADQHRQQVQPRHVQRLAAELDRLALDREAAHAQHVVQASGRTSGSARRRSSRPRCRRWCRRSGCSGRARSTGRGGAAASLMARLRTPHCTTAVRASLSTFTMRLNLASASVTPSSCGIAPPDRPVPAPRATTGTFSAWQAFSTAATWASVSGSATSQRHLAVGGEAVAFVGRGVLACHSSVHQGLQSRAWAGSLPGTGAGAGEAGRGAGAEGFTHAQRLQLLRSNACSSRPPTRPRRGATSPRTPSPGCPTWTP